MVMADHYSLRFASPSTSRYRSGNQYQHLSRSFSEEESPLDEVPLMMSEDGFESENESLTRRGKKHGPFRACCTRIWDSCCNCCSSLRCFKEKELHPRTVWFGRPGPQEEKYPPNKIRNQKYNFITFLPLVLFYQFRQFLNLYFLLMALSQFIPSLRIGYLYTYWAPLAFVIFVTMCREALDDLRRFRRDREVNMQKYTKLTKAGYVKVPSSEIQVSDLIVVEKVIGAIIFVEVEIPLQFGAQKIYDPSRSTVANVGIVKIGSYMYDNNIR